jgi:hypothetical protein
MAAPFCKRLFSITRFSPWFSSYFAAPPEFLTKHFLNFDFSGSGGVLHFPPPSLFPAFLSARLPASVQPGGFLRKPLEKLFLLCHYWDFFEF